MKQETAEELIDKAVKKAIREYDKEQKSAKKRKALHNTKMLLKNYNDIKKSIDEAIADVRQLEQDLIVMDDSDEFYIESIKRSKLRSIITIAHIDKALSVVQYKCEQRGMAEKYEIFVSCMLEGMNYDDAAVLYFSSKTSISRWVNDITRAISIQLFGVDGIEMI